MNQVNCRMMFMMFMTVEFATLNYFQMDLLSLFINLQIYCEHLDTPPIS